MSRGMLLGSSSTQAAILAHWVTYLLPLTGESAAEAEMHERCRPENGSYQERYFGPKQRLESRDLQQRPLEKMLHAPEPRRDLQQGGQPKMI